MNYIYSIIIIIVNIRCGYFIINDVKEKNIPTDRALNPVLGFLLGPIGLFIYLMARWETNNFTKLDKNEVIEKQNQEQAKVFEAEREAKLQEEQKLKIPTTCPNCKNPNNQKNEICEWCGNKTI